MTSRERVLTALEHGTPDRVPLFAFSVDPKFIRTFGHGNPLEAFGALGLDAIPLRAQNWCQGVPLLATLSGEIPEKECTAGGVFGGWNGVDEFGRVWRRGSYVGGTLKDWDDLDRCIPPLKLEERTPPAAVERVKARFPDKAYVLNFHSGPFGLTIESMGFETFCEALYRKRDLVAETIRRRTDWFIAVARHVVNLGADFVVMGDDVAFKGATFVSPADFRELVFPHYRRIAESLPVPVVWHSDGFIEPLLDMAVEAGFRGIHAMEPPAGNDMGRIKRRYGRELVLLGNVDCVEVLTGTDLARVRADVDRCMAQAKAGGGYMLASSNSLHAGCTVEAVAEMYRYGAEVGRY